MTSITKTEKIKKIKEATFQIIERSDINNISIYDIARHAKIATSTVYHHYPNIEALLLCIADDVFRDFDHMLANIEKTPRFDNWQAITWSIERAYFQYYQNNPVATKLVLGQHKFYDLRKADFEHDQALGERILKLYQQHFVLPALPNNYNIFAIALQAADKVYSTFYNTTGRNQISSEAGKEGYRLALAYLSVYLPQYLQRIEPTSEPPTEPHHLSHLSQLA